MSRLLWNALKLSPVFLSAIVLLSYRVSAQTGSGAELNLDQSGSSTSLIISSDEPISQNITSLEQINTSTPTNSMAQVTSVSQLSDVQPTDWAFQALQSLVERYGVVVGYPNGTFQGNRAITRYEFAAGLNAALNRVNQLTASGLAAKVSREDLATLRKLQEEFAAELATLRSRVDSIEAATTELAANQFSTTTKLGGRLVFAVNGGTIVGDRENRPDPNATAFSYGLLNFESSFTGSDVLFTQLVIGSGGEQDEATKVTPALLSFLDYSGVGPMSYSGGCITAFHYQMT